MDEIQALKAALQRERLARKQAESIIEQRSLELYEANQQLRTLNASLEQRIADRTEALENQKKELLEAKNVAVQAAHAKSAFLSKVSHELRTPLNAIIGFTHLLMENPAATENRKFLESIRFSARNLLDTINDVLDLANIESGTLELRLVPFSLRELLSDLRRNWELLLREKNVSFFFSLEESIPDQVVSDSAKLTQMLNNLLSNAAKFTESGYVRLAIDQSDRSNPDVVIFRVEDTGIGIPAEKQHLLFESFKQLHDKTGRNYGGSGLGLSITRQIAAAMGGTVQMESREGGGSVFLLTLPLKPASSQASPAPKTKPTEPAKQYPGKRVLIVDDMELNLKMLDHVLRRHGIAVTQAFDGREAMAHAMQNPFDLVFMDLQMPGMNGEEATAELRRVGYTTPIIALTADAFPATRNRVLKAGMQDFLTKPIDIVVFRQKLEEYLK